MSSRDELMATSTPHEELRTETLADPQVKAAYDALGPRYALISSVLGARQARGWTQQDLARACGMSQSSIARFESGEHDPRFSTIQKVCTALGITTVEIDAA